MPLQGTNWRNIYPNPSGLGTGPFTIEGWFSADDASFQQYLVHLNIDPTVTFYTILQLQFSKLTFVGAGQTTYIARGITNLESRRWYHLAVTCPNNGRSSDIKLFIDGVEETGRDATIPAATDSNSIGNHNGTITCGGREVDTARARTGKTHKVRIYNTIIPPQDFADYYNDTINNDLANKYFGNLVFRGDFDINQNSVNVGPSGVPANVSSTTATLTNRYPFDLPGLIAYYNFNSTGNTVSSSRITNLFDISNNSNDLIQGGANGPLVNSTPSGLSRGYASFNINVSAFAQRPTGFVLPLNSHSIIGFVEGFTTYSNLTQNQTILEFTNDINSTGINTTTYLQVDVSGRINHNLNGANNLVSNRLMSCTPVMIGFTSSSGDRKIYYDTDIVSGSALASSGISGVRIGTSGNSSRFSRFFGNMYELMIYQRPLASSEMSFIYNSGGNIYQYSAPTTLLSCEGSSTMEGFAAANNENLIRRMGIVNSGLRIYNFATSAQNLTNFSPNYSAQPGNANALFGYSKSNRWFLLQPYGNDYPSSYADLPSLQTDYNTYLNFARNDYDRIFVLQPQPRSDASDATDIAREAIGLDLNTWFGLQPNVTVIPRNSFISPASTGAADISGVTTGLHYAGDQIHLSALGYNTRAQDIRTVLLNAFSPIISSIVRSRVLSSLGKLNILDKLRGK